MAGLMARLANPPERKRIAEQTIAGMAHHWTDIFVSAVASAANQPLVGLNLQQIADARCCAPIDAVFDLLLEERGAVNQLEFNQSEENLRKTLTHPLASIISDGFYVKGKPHPRLHGTFPELLGTVCRERGWMDLPTAIHKITGRPAERFGLLDRGRLAQDAALTWWSSIRHKSAARQIMEIPKSPLLAFTGS
jgi:dihydroorotase/N-acyl-D-amino-acid deacylase